MKLTQALRLDRDRGRSVSRLRRLFTAHHLAQTTLERAEILDELAIALDQHADILITLDEECERDGLGQTEAEWTRVEAELVRFIAATEKIASRQGVVGIAPWNTTKIHALRENRAMDEGLRELSMVTDRLKRASLLSQMYDNVVGTVGGQAAEVIASLEHDLRARPRFVMVRRWWNRHGLVLR